jgi:3-methyladenine DNA glycosylase/8-oxoguanine DNA glycosylase
MELFTGISLRGWLLIGLAVVGFIFAGRYEYLRHQMTQDTQVITTQKVTIKSQDQAIKTAETVAKIEEHTQVTTQQAVKAVVQKHEAIQHKVQEQTHQIEQHYAETPPDPENIVAKAEELSRTRIDGLWEAYCTTQPNAEQCQPTGVPHA